MLVIASGSGSGALLSHNLGYFIFKDGEKVKPIKLVLSTRILTVTAHGGHSVPRVSCPEDRQEQLLQIDKF